MADDPVKITALTPGQVAKLLSQVGSWGITAEMVGADLDAGAPKNTDGTVNLIHYAAWLAREADNGSS